MVDRFSRLGLLIGADGLQRLSRARVLVAGLGGVGSFCAEALVRCGVGTIGAMDSDNSEPSNLNRQLFALGSTLGESKVDSFTRRARDINPDVSVEPLPLYLNRESFDSVDFSRYDIVADCIDSLVPKLNLILHCLQNEIPIVASTGAGFKTDPTQVRFGSIWDTRNDALAQRMRKKLRQWGYRDTDFTVVYSLEKRDQQKKGPGDIGSIVTVTGTFGLTIASRIVDWVLR